MTTEERLQALEEKVLGLEKEVTQLKLQLSNKATATARPVSSGNKAVQRPVLENPNGISTKNTTNKPVSNTQKQVSASKKENLETTIGKNVIGILASILFFIAFIVFGTFIYQNLGNMGRSILLFAGSFLITGIGLLLQTKLKNAFSLSVIGCGMGCFYITLIINTIYFEFLSELGLYSLLLVWLLGMSLLSKKYESTLLCIIGQCGLYLSILFGVTNETMSDFLWFSFFIFFLVADILYLRICAVENHQKLRTLSTMGTIISCILIASRNYSLSRSYMEEKDTSVIFTLIYFAIMLILLAYSLYHFHKTAKAGMEQNKSFSTFLASIYFFCIYSIYGETTGMLRLGLGISTQFINILDLIFGIGVILYLEILVEKYGERKLTNFISILNIPYLLLLVVICFFNLNWDNYSLLVLLIVPLLFYGFYKGKKLYQALGLIVLFIHFWTGSNSDLLHFFLTMATFFVAFWLQKKYLDSYSGITKAAIYFLFLIYCFQPAGDLNYFLRSEDFVTLSQGMIYVLLLTPLQIFALKSDFTKNYKDLSKTEKYMEFFLRAENILLLFIGVTCLYDSIPDWGYLLLIIATSLLCFIGVKQFLMQHPQKLWAGFYVGIKITIYLSAVFYSTPISNRILFSILLLCIAVIAILIGFKFKLKSLRIYGLFLTMMSVVKLILFDVDYSSTLGTVTALMICGVLCFIINFIYNMLSKHIIAEQSVKEES